MKKKFVKNLSKLAKKKLLKFVNQLKKRFANPKKMKFARIIKRIKLLNIVRSKNERFAMVIRKGNPLVDPNQGKNY